MPALPALPIPEFIPLPLVAGVAAFLAIVYLVLALTDDRREELRAVVRSYTTEPESPPLGRAVPIGSFGQRVAGPTLGMLVRLLSSTAPGQMRKQARRKLTMAGDPMSVSTFLALRGLVFFGFPLAYTAYVSLSGGWGPRQLLYLGVVAVAGRILPNMMLNSRIRARQKQIERTIPDAVDLLVACVEGGLSLDGAMVKVTERMTGPLSDEIGRAQHEIGLGRQRRDAIREMAERTGVQSLRSLSQSIVQAEQMGISVADVLRSMGDQLREKRRLKAQEMAQKAPVKMIPVMMLFTLPSVMIVTIGPAIISILKFLTGG